MIQRPTAGAKRQTAIVLLALCLSVAGVLVAGRGALAGPGVVLSSGHIDIGLDYEGGTLVLNVHDKTAGPVVQRDPGDVVLRALPASQTTVPSGPAYSFLGAPGSPVWILPQTQNPSLLWPGWNTDDIPVGVFVGNSVKWALKSVSGPGQFALYTVGQFGAVNVLFNSSDGISGADELNVAVPSHTHANWAFSAPGTYSVGFELSGNRVAGGSSTTGIVTYTFDIDSAVGGSTSLARVAATPNTGAGSPPPWAIPVGVPVGVLVVLSAAVWIRRVTAA
jgi:surface-anchored protein